VYDSKPGGNFKKFMHKALIESDAVLCVVSEKYLQSENCIDEWTSADALDKPFIPLRIEGVRPEGLLAPRVYINLFGEKDSGLVREKMLDGLEHALKDVPTRPTDAPRFPGGPTRPTTEPRFPGGQAKAAEAVAGPEPQFPGAMPSNNLPRQNPYFAGRKQQLNDIFKAFCAGGPVSVNQTISGLGGVGKTQTAIHYAYTRSDQYTDAIWFVNAETRASILTSYGEFLTTQGLAEQNSDEDAIAARTKNWLSADGVKLFWGFDIK
jgi:hypothetical protein